MSPHHAGSGRKRSGMAILGLLSAEGRYGYAVVSSRRTGAEPKRSEIFESATAYFLEHHFPEAAPHLRTRSTTEERRLLGLGQSRRSLMLRLPGDSGLVRPAYLKAAEMVRRCIASQSSGRGSDSLGQPVQAMLEIEMVPWHGSGNFRLIHPEIRMCGQSQQNSPTSRLNEQALSDLRNRSRRDIRERGCETTLHSPSFGL